MNNDMVSSLGFFWNNSFHKTEIKAEDIHMTMRQLETEVDHLISTLQLYKLLTRAKGRLGRRAATALSLLSCFCGGVILGVCLIELIPEARENWEQALKQLDWHSDYPYVELFTGCGFFIVYFVEEFMNQLCGLKHDHSDEGASVVFA